ncbi:hypothetical protein R54767_03562 [Paraburkholderia gardini]|uniref:Uncharacterized protein n=1 Tax=Paraburkholderia gardini TaxID=2823469 RepID=A0ABM8U6K4_9BURK|nr:hypothetical protein R54767_03562 [Paraburkholderia gardini]
MKVDRPEYVRARVARELPHRAPEWAVSARDLSVEGNA